MKLYFEDSAMDYAPDHVDWCPDGEFGYEEFEFEFNQLKKYKKDLVVYTNYLPILYFAKDFWNEQDNCFEIYFKSSDLKWHRIDKFVNKNLLKTMNIEKMYVAGVFEYTCQNRNIIGE